MKRFALIIEVSEVPNADPIDGCKRDAERWKAWLSGDNGGAWNSANNEEIKVLNCPKLAEIQAWLTRVHDADFAILAFSGHGHIEEDAAGRQKQMVTLGNGYQLDFSTIAPRATRSIISCDACREVHVAEPLRYAKSAAVFNERAMKRFSRQEYRTMFENAVDSTKPGSFTLYSCSPNEYALDNPLTGGFFTDSLLSVAFDACNSQEKTGWYGIADVFTSAKPIVTQRAADKGYSQIPMGSSLVRGGNNFPIGVVLS